MRSICSKTTGGLKLQMNANWIIVILGIAHYNIVQSEFQFVNLLSYSHGSSELGWTLGAPIKSCGLLLQSQSANPVPSQLQLHKLPPNSITPPFLHVPVKYTRPIIRTSVIIPVRPSGGSRHQSALEIESLLVFKICYGLRERKNT